MKAVAPGRPGDEALLTYEAMASIYDDFTAHHDYDGWLTDLLVVLGHHGLQGRRLLDVGCGTGKSFLPMVPRGWEVTGCDISPAMLALAEEKVGDSVDLLEADMRALPRFGEFDLIWALDDVINYLLSVGELTEALLGMRANLAGSGLLMFDVNELLVYRTIFAETEVFEQKGWRFRYEGDGDQEAAPGLTWESRLEAEPCDGNLAREDRSEVSVHRQRHFPEAEIRAALGRVGLECLDVYGQRFDGVPCQPLDTAVHVKAIYVARRVSG